MLSKLSGGRIQKLISDPRAVIFSRLRQARIASYSLVSTTITCLIAHLMGVAIGRGVRFIGVPVFHRHPLSTIQIGDHCLFRSDRSSNLIGVMRKCIFSTHYSSALIQVGSDCGFSGCVIGAAQKVVVGNRVLVGANVLITDFDWHAVDPNERRGGYVNSRPVTIADNVWIGVNVVILKGVSIGENSVIGANSVVTKSIPDNVVAAGNPCAVIRDILEVFP